MKSLILIFVAVFGLTSASFWTNCPNTNAPGPDYMRSPFCGETRCSVVRGQNFTADIYATPQGSHVELRTRITAFVLGIGNF